MKATLAILATSVVTAITLYVRKRRRNKDMKTHEGVFHRLFEGRTNHGT